MDTRSAKDCGCSRGVFTWRSKLGNEQLPHTCFVTCVCCIIFSSSVFPASVFTVPRPSLADLLIKGRKGCFRSHSYLSPTTDRSWHLREIPGFLASGRPPGTHLYRTFQEPNNPANTQSLLDHGGGIEARPSMIWDRYPGRGIVLLSHLQDAAVAVSRGRRFQELHQGY